MDLDRAPAIIIMTSGVCFQTRECRAGCADLGDDAVSSKATALGA